jgi:hypothetical protein
MRGILRLLFASLAVLAGLFGALLLAVVGFVFFVFRQMLGRPAVMPRFQKPAGPTFVRPTPAGHGDVIDVVATEVKE